MAIEIMQAANNWNWLQDYFCIQATPNSHGDYVQGTTCLSEIVYIWNTIENGLKNPHFPPLPRSPISDGG